jgi:ABC-type branched-subunit amino acid transport system substrate-binding protein
MTMNRRQALALACASAAGVALPSLASAKSANVLRLGQSTALDGPNGAIGRQFRDAARAWFARTDTEGGARIELVTLDDGGQVERATINTKLLASAHGVSGFFGFAGPGANREGMIAAQEERMPFIAPISGVDALRQPGNSGVYLLRAGHREEIHQIIRHVSSIGMSRVALVFEYESAGWEMRDSFVDAAQAAGLANSVSASVSRGSTDVSSATVVIGAANPQAIVLAANTAASAAFVRAMRRIGYGGSFYTVSTVGGRILLDQLGPIAAGMSVAQVVPFPWNGTTPISREFLAFCAKSGVAPDFASMEGYMAARWLTEALKRARSRDIDPAALAAALERMPAVDLGGFPLAFNAQTRSASTFVELTVVSSGLKFLT